MPYNLSWVPEWGFGCGSIRVKRVHTACYRSHNTSASITKYTADTLRKYLMYTFKKVINVINILSISHTAGLYDIQYLYITKVTRIEAEYNDGLVI